MVQAVRKANLFGPFDPSFGSQESICLIGVAGMGDEYRNFKRIAIGLYTWVSNIL